MEVSNILMDYSPISTCEGFYSGVLFLFLVVVISLFCSFSVSGGGNPPSP